MRYIGIDPGLDGAVGVISGDSPHIAVVNDTPTAVVKGRGTKRVYLPQAMTAILEAYIDDRYTVVLIEKVHAMPRQGVTSSFSFGHGLGLWEGICAGLGLSYDFVTPQSWQGTMMDGMGKAKDASRVVALRLFPHLAETLSRKRDHGRADALLIAEYRRRQG